MAGGLNLWEEIGLVVQIYWAILVVILVGKVAMLAGIGLFIGSVIGATVTGKKCGQSCNYSSSWRTWQS